MIGMNGCMKLLLALVLLASLASAVSVERELKVTGSTAEVTLTIYPSANTTGIIISEILPEGAVFTSGTPAPSKISGSDYTWLIFGEALAEGTITYSFTNPQGNFEPSGTWKTIYEQGAIVNATPKPPAQPAPTQQPAQGASAATPLGVFELLIVIAVLVVLAAIIGLGLKLKKK